MGYRRSTSSNRNERPKRQWEDPFRFTGGADITPPGDTRWCDLFNAGYQPSILIMPETFQLLYPPTGEDGEHQAPVIEHHEIF